MKRFAKNLCGMLLYSVILSLVFNLIFVAAFILSLLLFSDSFGSVLLIVIMCCAPVAIIIIARRMFGLNKRFGAFSGGVYALTVAIDAAVFWITWKAMSASFDFDMAIIALVVYIVSLVPLFVASVAGFTSEASPRMRLDPEARNYMDVDRKQLFNIGVTLVSCVLFAAMALVIFRANIRSLRELQDGADIVTVAKGGDRVYYITSDGEMYVNGSSTTSSFSASYGFSSYNLYEYRFFAGLTRPVYVRSGVADIIPTSYGGMIITRSGDMLVFDKSIENYTYPVRMASDVVSCDLKQGHLFYVTSDGKLYYRDLVNRTQPRVVAEGVSKVEHTTDCVAVLTQNGELHLAAVSALTAKENESPLGNKVDINVVSFSARNALTFMAYVKSNGDCMYTEWSVIGDKCYVNSSDGMPRKMASSASEVYAGYAGTAIVMNDGSVSLRTSGCSFNGGRLSDVKPRSIAADFGSLCVVMPDGSVKAYGNTEKGQAGLLDMSEASFDGLTWTMFAK